ncbi:MAG: hypothetical protein HKN44_04900 [Ilumatobacter sp.]|nr:hypothetical protein [Ilumatobacter sp.]
MAVSIVDLATIDEAAEVFGEGLVITEAALASDVVLLDHTGTTGDGLVVAPDAPDVVIRSINVRSVHDVGLTREVVTAMVMRPAGESTVPPLSPSPTA